MKSSKVVVVLAGRHAGKKGVVVKTHDDGSNDRTYGHALVAGIEKYPLRVTKRMGKKRTAKRTRIKPFLRVYNYNHLMPTRLGGLKYGLPPPPPPPPLPFGPNPWPVLGGGDKLFNSRWGVLLGKLKALRHGPPPTSRLLQLWPKQP